MEESFYDTSAALKKLEETRNCLLREIEEKRSELNLVEAKIREIRFAEQVKPKNKKVTIKNSRLIKYTRLIYSVLKENEKIRTRDIYNIICQYGDNINYSTFRSYLLNGKKEGYFSYDESSRCWSIK